MVSSLKRVMERIKVEDTKIKNSLDLSFDWKSIKISEFHQLPFHEKALARGVRIRIITERHQGKEFENLFPSLNHYDLFEIRYVDPPIPIRCAIYDKRKVNMSVQSRLNSNTTPFLWSSNPEFVKVIVSFFDEMWTHINNSKIA